MAKTDNDYIAIRNRIFDLLKESKMPQNEFAKIIQVSPQTITDWKKGKSNSFSTMLSTISSALNTTPGWLFSGEGLKYQTDKDKHDQSKSQLEAAILSIQASEHKVSQELKNDFKVMMQRNGWTATDFVSDDIKNIAASLGISVQELLGEEKSDPTTVSDDEAALDRELISRLVQLTPEELEKVDAFVQGLLAAR